MPVPEGWSYEQEWAYLVLPEYDHTVDYSNPAISDAEWPRSTAPFGGPDTVHPIYGRRPQTVIPKNSTTWYRARLNGAGATAIPLDIDGNIAMWLDGVLLYQADTPGFSITIDVPQGGDLLAVRVDNDFSDPSGDWTWFDFPLPSETPVVRRYPRDDGRGLSAAPRLHPLPRSTDRRVVGGIQ